MRSGESVVLREVFDSFRGELFCYAPRWIMGVGKGKEGKASVHCGTWRDHDRYISYQQRDTRPSSRRIPTPSILLSRPLPLALRPNYQRDVVIEQAIVCFKYP